MGQRFTLINNSYNWQYESGDGENPTYEDHYYVIEVLDNTMKQIGYFYYGKSGEMIYDGTRWHTYTF